MNNLLSIAKTSTAAFRREVLGTLTKDERHKLFEEVADRMQADGTISSIGRLMSLAHLMLQIADTLFGEAHDKLYGQGGYRHEIKRAFTTLQFDFDKAASLFARDFLKYSTPYSRHHYRIEYVCILSIIAAYAEVEDDIRPLLKGMQSDLHRIDPEAMGKNRSERLTIRLQPEVYRVLKQYAEKYSVTLSSLAAELILQRLNYYHMHDFNSPEPTPNEVREKSSPVDK